MRQVSLPSCLDTLLDLLARVPGSCAAFARMTPGSDQECSLSLSEKLRKHIETTTPADQEGRGETPRFVNVESTGSR